MTEGTGGTKGLVGSLLHGLEILDMFERDRPEIGIGEMAVQLGLHRSTTSRLAATLATAGYLESTGDPGRYRLSGKLAALGELVVADGQAARRAALPYLRELVAEVGETGHLAVLEGAEAVTVEVVDGWQTVRMHSWVGKRSPAHCSSMGKALLAGLPAAELKSRHPDGLVARTAHTITDLDELERHLAQVRDRGYAVDLEELEEHLCCVAAPVFDRTGAVVASISVSGPAARIHDATIPALVVSVSRAARRISDRLGAPATPPGWT